jgi:hypothetical protein
MGFLHYEVELETKDKVQVTLDHAANVLLLDTSNYTCYKAGKDCTFYGGYAKQSPVIITPPYRGHWHVVIDLDGHGGSVRAAVTVLHS